MIKFLRKKKQVELFSPCSGKVISISEVNDPVFSQKLLGEGFAVIPEEQTIYAPLAGQVTTIFPTKHAISIKSNSGIDYLIHIGIDTVELEGKPFSILVDEKEYITPENPLVKVDFKQLELAKKDSSVIICFTESSQIDNLDLYTGRVLHGVLCGYLNLS